MGKMKLELVDDKEAIERRWSVRLAKIGAAAMAGWGSLTAAGLVGSVPAWVSQAVAALVLVCITGAAYLKQPAAEEKKDDAQ